VVPVGRGTMSGVSDPGSPSLANPDYWWYRVRSELLEVTLSDTVGDNAAGQLSILDLGSADGPSVGWLRTRGHRVGMDIDPRGLHAGDVCGSAMDLPFGAASFDVVAAFDVIEHCDPEDRVLAEVSRVLRPGGRFLMSVPAYQWAWTAHDVHNGHHRRYTKSRAVAAVTRAGFDVDRATYMFAGTFPLFAADRLRRRLSERRGRTSPAEVGGVADLPDVGRTVEPLLSGLSSIDRRLLARRDLPFGSSVVIAAVKSARPLKGHDG
jgi:SAM-dependent methyltransferase